MKYEVINLKTGEPHGKYATFAEAKGAVIYDRLRAWAIWNLAAGVCVARQDPS